MGFQPFIVIITLVKDHMNKKFVGSNSISDKEFVEIIWLATPHGL